MPFAVVAITSWRSWRYHVIKMIKPVVLQTDHFVLHSREKSRDFHLFFSPKWKSQVGQFKTVINVVFARNSNYLYMSLFYKHTKFRLMYMFFVSTSLIIPSYGTSHIFSWSWVLNLLLRIYTVINIISLNKVLFHIIVHLLSNVTAYRWIVKRQLK